MQTFLKFDNHDKKIRVLFFQALQHIQNYQNQ